MNFRCVVGIPLEIARSLGWQHRDDLAYSIVDGELRLRKQPERDLTKDRVPGGRYDGWGRIRPPPPFPPPGP